MKPKLLLSIFMLLLAQITSAQVTGLVEDFNDNQLTGWEVPADHQRTYTLTETDGVLKIDYHRTASSWEWDNFNFSPPLIDISQHPRISVKVKSDTKSMLIFKPVYNQTEVAWLKQQLADDNEWYTITFKIENPGANLIDRIYMYLDGGSTSSASGTVYFDDLKIGDQADIVADLSELKAALKAANALFQHSIEGTSEGEFALGSKAIFKTAIDSAQALYDSLPASQDAVDAMVWNLYDACVTFETGAVVKDFPLDIVDDRATKETKYLFLNLDKLAKTNLLFGMQDATGYGVGWTNDDDRSDVKDVCGSYPAVYGWGISGVAENQDVARLKYRMTSAFERGGVNTMEWHQLDPQNRGFYAADVKNERIVATLLPGGQYHDLYREKLQRIARYMKRLRGTQGQSIPVIFRPYHENIGSWFWWGADHCTREEFMALWRFTVSHLRDSLNVHNLLYAYSPDNFSDKAHYLDRYPGNDYVDVLGTDQYLSGSITSNAQAQFMRRLRDVVELARERNKIAALTETGRETIDIHDWFTRILLNPIKNDSTAKNLAYAAVWRNAHAGHHYAPYPGHPSVPDFLKFFDDPFTLFESDLPDMYALVTVDSLPPHFTKLPASPFISHYSTVTLEAITNEPASLRYSTVNQPFRQMPFEFEYGQGITRHATTIKGKHGQSYTFYFRAEDQYGNAMDTSAVVSFSIDTLGAPIHWMDLSYDVSAWKIGTAPLGFGSSEVVTQLANVRTAYLRYEFNLENASSISYFSLILKYDNGVALYLNGQEVGRVNLPFGELTYETWATDASSGFKAVTLTTDQIKLLKNGTNVLAVEIHQAEADPSDLLIDIRALAPNPVI
ncbi:MAG: glycosyl hydrolase, partial [candidate division KSB1 bacterium]|nr:glycosyl hydrolase [candidate division KSB1 bacterium]